MPGFGDNPTLPPTPPEPGEDASCADSWSIPPQGHHFEKAGDRIGPYRLLQPLGEGGFGIVWLAERREPMVQRVAIKVLKPGMDSRSILARFEQVKPQAESSHGAGRSSSTMASDCSMLRASIPPMVAPSQLALPSRSMAVSTAHRPRATGLH